MKEKSLETKYQELMQAIINKQKEILGPKVAVDRAKNVSELWLDSEGEILQVKGNPEAALQSLINEYFKLTTQAGLNESVQIIKSMVKGSDLELPEEIKILMEN